MDEVSLDMTRKLLPLLLGAVAIAAAPAQAQPRERPSGEAELARALEGCVAGEPVDCLNLHSIRSSRTICGTALLYEVGGVIYVNRPRSGADQLDGWSAQINRSTTNSLCSVDTLELVDPTTGMFRGVVFLDEFVPYRRVRRGD